MKKFILSLLLIAGATAAITAFHACASDEADEQALSPQAQLLLKKSREFAQKYHVDMTLNEENIEETAKTLTVAQLENDYREWAEAIKTPIELKVTAPEGKTANKIKLRRRISELEVSGSSNDFDGEASFGRIGNIYHADVNVHWKYISQTENEVVASVKAYSLMGGDSGSCGNIHLSPVFDTTGPRITFSANGDFYISGIRYTKKLHMHVYYNEGNDIKSISIS